MSRSGRNAVATGAYLVADLSARACERMIKRANESAQVLRKDHTCLTSNMCNVALIGGFGNRICVSGILREPALTGPVMTPGILRSDLWH